MSIQNFLLAVLLLVLALPGLARAQSTGLLRGTVTDAQGGVVPGARVELVRPTTGFLRAVDTGVDGQFELTGLPPAPYELRVSLPGFEPSVRVVEVQGSVPVQVAVTLAPAPQTVDVRVTPEVLPVDTASGGTRHQLAAARIETMPRPVGSRGVESVLVSFPGFAQNANGAIHARGAHNQMTYVVDGLPISDQLTGAFANALDAGVVDAVELMTGNIPPQFGGKVSGVAVVTSRSGADLGRRATAEVGFALAQASTVQVGTQVGGRRGRVGYFVSTTSMRTDRFLDQISSDNLHNAGAFGRGFARVDIAPTPGDRFRLNAMGGRSAFEVANLRSQHAAGQDQRQSLGDAAVWGAWLHMLDDVSTLEAVGGYRHSRARLTPSAADRPVRAEQARTLDTLTASLRYTRVAGQQQFLAGADLQRFPVSERFGLGITSVAFNEPGTPTYNPALAAHDLTRGGAPFWFQASGTGQTEGLFAQATLRRGAATFTVGARHDRYRFLVRGQQFQPRVGLTVELPGDGGALRVSYNRNYQTPPNENLLLSSSREAAALAPESVRVALGGGWSPVQPERQDVFEAGYQRGVGSLGTLDVAVYRKRSRNQQDNNSFFDTAIILPVTLAALRVTGAEGRLSFRERRGTSGAVSVTTGRATSTPPFTGGLFLGQDAVDLLSSGPFVIDHDQRLSVHGNFHADLPGPLGLAGAARYDSGLVSNPSDLALVAADPDFADLLPYVNLTASVPRVRPRTIVDALLSWDVRAPQGGRRWSLQAQVTNLTGRTALYSFQSVFVGTRLVQPRTFAVRLTRVF